MGFVLNTVRGKDAEHGFAEPGRRIKTVQGKTHWRGLFHWHGSRFLWVLSFIGIKTVPLPRQWQITKSINHDG